MIDVRDRCFTTSTLCAATGCDPATLRAWRNRNDLFPETRVEGTNRRPWNTFSIMDMLIVRTVVVMTSHGLPANNAVWFASGHAKLLFGALLADRPGTTWLVGFHRGGHPGEAHIKASFVMFDEHATLADSMAKCQGVVTILDLHSIIDFVLTQIEELQPETFAHEGGAKGLIAKAMLEVFERHDAIDDEEPEA